MREDIVKLLTNDHDEARRLLSELEEAKGERAERTLERLREAMMKHSRAEEQVVYPFYRECVGSEEAQVDVAESKLEHENVDELLDALVGLEPGSVDFQARLKFAKESIEHHAGEEEKEMFPTMRKQCPPDQLEEIAQQFKKAKENVRVPGGGRDTKEDLYEEARKQGIEGRSDMDKKDLQKALGRDH